MSQTEKSESSARDKAPMNNVTLKKDGLITRNRKTVGPDLLKVLNYQVDLEKGYSLRSWFEMLEKYPMLEKMNDFFPMFREQYHACPEGGCCCEGIDYLEFNKTVEMIGFPGKRLEIYNSFMGVCGQETLEIKSMQIENLLDLPVELGNLKHVVFGDQVDIFEFETVYTFFEFLDGIAWELSFLGTPKQCETRR